MQVAGLVETNEALLYPVYFAPLVLNAAQPLDDLTVNERFLPFVLREKKIPELNLLIKKLANYDKEQFAEQLVVEPELRSIAALLFN